MSKLNTILLLISGLLIHGQHDAGATSAHTPTRFVSATPTAQVSLEELKAFSLAFGQRKVTSFLRYGTHSYTLVYETDYLGNKIKASGLIIVPKGLQDKAPIVSLQHGTIFANDEAPSISGGYPGMELFASAGYITLMPDFIGYGSSAGVFHPYYDKEYSAMAVIDMIKAAKEFLAGNKIPFSEELFLAGYSEGGYVTLAAAKEIELNPAHRLTLTAVAAGAGGYDLGEMLKAISVNSYYSYPAYLAFVLMAYNKTYGWNKPLTHFFKKKYADVLSKYMTGEFYGGTINSRLTTNLSELFNAEFYAALKQSNGEIELKKVLKRNSVSGWRSNIPIRLYHGTNDEIIPYQNSEATFNNFKTAGSKDVTLTAIPGGTHGSAFFPMLEKLLPWFLVEQ